MKFGDASAIIPLCLDEPRTTRLRKMTEEDGAMVVWWGAPIECCSAFARLRREAVFTRADEEQARQLLALSGNEGVEIEPSTEVREKAARILLLHPLKAADSLQLAAALV